MTRRPQFSIRLLLLTVAVVAAVLALMFQSPVKVASPALITLLIVCSALALTGAMAGRLFLRSYCLGALVPMGIALFHLATNAGAFLHLFDELPPFEYESVLPYTFSHAEYPKLLGACLLVSIATAYLCVACRWLIEQQGPPESPP
jgi:hypothetical protein